MDLFSAGSLMSGIGDLSSSVFNLGSGIANYNYMKNVQRESWNREDNAVQRRAEDLQKAGLSKTLAAGSAASSSAPVNLKAPQANVNSMQKLMNYKAMTQMNAQIAKTKADAMLSQINANRAKLENNIRQRDFNIIQGKATGQRSDLNDTASQIMNGVNTLLGNIQDKNVIKSTAGDIAHKAKTVVNDIPKEVTKVKSDVKKGVSYIPENVKKGASSVKDAIKDKWQSIMNDDSTHPKYYML